MGCSSDTSTKLESFHGNTLEVVGVPAHIFSLSNIVHACPMLKCLVVLGCNGIEEVSIELKLLN